MTEKELFISWLNDAYATELAMIPVLENHAEDARDYPQIRERDLQHLEETKHQAERVKMLIENLGGKVSTAKTLTGKISGFGQSLTSEFFSDELIKNFLSDYAAEHLEIASYKTLIAAAKYIGEHECVPVLKEILAEEEAMAAWLAENIPMATRESIKIVTSDDGKKEKKSNGKRNVAAKIFSPSALVTVLGIGAVGAGAAMLLKNSSKDKTDGDGANAERRLESADGARDSRISQTSEFGQDEVQEIDFVITETVIITDEPEILPTRRAAGETF